MAEEEKEKTFTLTLKGLKLKDLVQVIIMAGGFGFLGVQQVGPDKPIEDPDDKPVTVRQFEEHQASERASSARILKQLEKQNDKLDFLYKIELQQLNQKKKYGQYLPK